MLEWIVSSKDSGVKLLSFLSHYLEEKYSARLIKRMIESNCCQINGRTERFASTLLGKGDHVCLYLEQFSPMPEPLEESRILYEDDALLVYNKPSGVTSDEKGVVKLLKTRDSSLQLIHRLDRDTTGVLLLAKQVTVFEKLVNQFKQFQVRKRYLAIVDGYFIQTKGIIENYLGKKHAYAGQMIWGAVHASKGLYACTEWQQLKKGKMASLLVCFPKTGRTHQIRVHMAEMNHPVLGDFQYSEQFQCAYRPSRYLLHAEAIQFDHPITQKPVCLVAPLPEDFKIAQQKLFKE